MTKLIFWFSFLMIFYAYFGYPCMLFILSMHRKRKIDKKNFEPRVSLIIPVFNGERIIAEKLDNTLQLLYPKEKLEIIVSSDGSTDRTNLIVEGYGKQGITLVVLSERLGKAAALNRGLEISKGDIVIFSDASIMLERHSVRAMVENFVSDQIGCVSGEDYIASEDGGEGIYGRYELVIRRLESRVFSIVGASGCFYAQRKNLIDPFPEGMAPDFVSVLSVVKKGLRAISDQESRGFMNSVWRSEEELPRKVRTVLRGMTALFHHCSLLNPFRYELFSFQLISHKIIRWLVPFFMILLFFANLALIENRYYLIGLLAQLVSYGLALLGFRLGDLTKKSRLLGIPSYFLLSNIAILIAWMKYIRGESQEIWEPSVRA